VDAAKTQAESPVGQNLRELIAVSARIRGFRAEIRVRGKTHFACGFNPITFVRPCRENILLSFFQKMMSDGAILLPQEGRIAIVTDVGGGMRWT
jgi:hypothetical protein